MGPDPTGVPSRSTLGGGAASASTGPSGRDRVYTMRACSHTDDGGTKPLCTRNGWRFPRRDRRARFDKEKAAVRIDASISIKPPRDDVAAPMHSAQANPRIAWGIVNGQRHGAEDAAARAIARRPRFQLCAAVNVAIGSAPKSPPLRSQPRAPYAVLSTGPILTRRHKRRGSKRIAPSGKLEQITGGRPAASDRRGSDRAVKRREWIERCGARVNRCRNLTVA
jgi:hypothetical protein